MTTYKCTLMSVAQLAVGSQGFVMPMCDQCDTQDCTNPIERKSVSVLGVTKKVKVFVKGMDEYFVVECMGFSKE